MSRDSFNNLVNTSSQLYFYAKTSLNPEGNTEIMSYWGVNGTPPIGAYKGTGAGVSGEVLNARSTGAMMYPTGSTCYVTRIQRNGIPSNPVGTIIVYDRLWQNTGFINTSADQGVNSVMWPERDDSGLASGYGVYIALETSVVMANSVSVTGTYIEYTNTEGQGPRLGYLRNFPITANAGCFIPFTLDIGDKGVKSVETLVLGSSVITGTSCHLVAYRPIAVLSNSAMSESNDIFSLPMNKIYDDSCLAIALAGMTSAGNFNLSLSFNRD